MAKNIFEMLGLEFDPPDNLKKIRAAYENWKKRLIAEQNTTVETARLEIIKSELEMDSYIVRTIEDSRLRQIEAKALKQNRIEQLRNYIDLQRGDVSGTLQVNQTQIKQIKDKLKLSIATIEATYKEQGFEIKKARTGQSITETLNNFFIADSIMADMHQHFAAFQKVPDEQNYPWSAEVSDLYDLAWHLENKIESSAEFYKRRDTEELLEIFKNEAKKVSSPIPAWQSIKAILNLAQTQIFNSDDNRFKYDHTLKIGKLNDFFAKLKVAPDVFKHDSYFADNCISRIRRTFPNMLDYELSAALYNKAAGLLKTPYESVENVEENFFCVTCSNCGAFENFRTREEAERTVCKICGEHFYTDCPKCGKKIPSTAKHCPNCEFSLESLHNYNYYVERANFMLDVIERSAKYFDDDMKVILAGVMENLANAGMVKPESNELTKIEWRINRVVADSKKRELIRWAGERMPALTVHADTAVSRCMEILSKVKDYKPAIARLKLIPPKKPLSITAVVRENVQKNTSSILNKISVRAKSSGLATQSVSLTCTVHWQPANDLGVSYILVRKVDGIPQNHRDGKIIVENTDRIEIDDTNIKPGILYGYAIFAVRYEAISEPTTCTFVHYSDIEENKLIAKSEDGHCKFTWRLPSENCLGVRILRSDFEGNNLILADCVTSPFVDRSVKNLKPYQYRLQCVYWSAEDEIVNRQKFLTEVRDESINKIWKFERQKKYSNGLTVTLTPELPPRPVKNLNFSVANYRVNFNWQSTGEFYLWFKEVHDDKKISEIQPGKVFNLDKIDELLGSGLVLRRAKSSDNTCEFEMRGSIMKIAVVGATTNFGVVNKIFTVANVEPCEIDEINTKIFDDGLKLVLRSLPKNLYMIHYKIADEDSEEIYATIEDAKELRVNRIYAAKYEQDKSISQPHPPRKMIYITVIGEYKLSDGTTAYSAPSTFILNNRPKFDISYRLEWGKSFGFLNKRMQAKNCRLVIESNAPSTPPMFLACRKDGRENIELGDASTLILNTIPEYKNGLPNKHLEITLPDTLWDKIPAGTFVKLFISANDVKFFELKTANSESLVVPKK